VTGLIGVVEDESKLCMTCWCVVKGVAALLVANQDLLDAFKLHDDMMERYQIQVATKANSEDNKAQDDRDDWEELHASPDME
jgi:hypothetical protein